MRHLTRAAIGLATGFLLLTGCSSLGNLMPGGGATSEPAASSSASEATSAPSDTGGSSGQSASEACTVLGDTMNEAGQALQDVGSNLGNDPEKALKALDDFRASFETAVTKVDNPEVKAQAQKALDALDALIAALKAGIKDTSKMPDMLTALSDFQTEMTAFATVCTG